MNITFRYSLMVLGSFIADLLLTGFMHTPIYIFTRIIFYLGLVEPIAIWVFLVSFLAVLLQNFLYSNFFYLELSWLIFCLIFVKQIKSVMHQYFLTKFFIVLSCLVGHYLLVTSIIYSNSIDIWGFLSQITIFSILILGIMTYFKRGKLGNRLRVTI